MNKVPFKMSYSCCALRVYKPQSAEEGSRMQADPLIHLMLSDLQLPKWRCYLPQLHPAYPQTAWSGCPSALKCSQSSSSGAEGLFVSCNHPSAICWHQDGRADLERPWHPYASSHGSGQEELSCEEENVSYVCSKLKHRWVYWFIWFGVFESLLTHRNVQPWQILKHKALKK